MVPQAQQQNYKNHRQIVPVLHYFLVPLSLVAVLFAILLIVRNITQDGPLLETVTILMLSIILLLIVPLSRQFAIKVQDRLIRTEEELRHYRLTGKWLDPRLTIKQLIALRFAADEEFPTLCHKAAEQRLEPSVIKQSIVKWRGDYYRV